MPPTSDLCFLPVNGESFLPFLGLLVAERLKELHGIMARVLKHILLRFPLFVGQPEFRLHLVAELDRTWVRRSDRPDGLRAAEKGRPNAVEDSLIPTGSESFATDVVFDCRNSFEVLNVRCYLPGSVRRVKRSSSAWPRCGKRNSNSSSCRRFETTYRP